MLEKEFAERDSKMEESPPKEGESKSLDESMQQVPPRLTKQRKLFLTFHRLGQINDPYVEHQEHYSLLTAKRPMRTRKSFLAVSRE